MVHDPKRSDCHRNPGGSSLVGYQQPTLPASTENYAQLVHDLTAQLQQSIEPIWSALNLRSMALSKCANFDAALYDANVMQ